MKKQFKNYRPKWNFLMQMRDKGVLSADEISKIWNLAEDKNTDIGFEAAEALGKQRYFPDISRKAKQFC